MGARTLSLSKGVVDAVEKFVEEHAEYRSLADFFTEAARLRLQDLERLLLKRKELSSVG